MTDLRSRVARIGSLAPVSCTTATAGDYISLKNALRCIVQIFIGVVTGTVTIQLRQAKNVSGTGVKALEFTHVWRQGGKLGISSVTGTFQVGETVTETSSGATAVVYRVSDTELILHTNLVAAFTGGLTVTGGASGATATGATGGMTHLGMKMRVALSAAANTVAIGGDGETYEIEIDPASLDTANDFDCIMADVSAVSSGTALVSIDYLVEQRYVEDPQLSLLVD